MVNSYGISFNEYIWLATCQGKITLGKGMVKCPHSKSTEILYIISTENEIHRLTFDFIWFHVSISARAGLSNKHTPEILL